MIKDTVSDSPQLERQDGSEGYVKDSASVLSSSFMEVNIFNQIKTRTLYLSHSQDAFFKTRLISAICGGHRS